MTRIHHTLHSFSLLLLAVLLNPSIATESRGTAGAGLSRVDAVNDAGKEPISQRNFEVVILTTENFGKNIGDGSVWLVEFYAPWCSHCMSFAPTYSEIARHFHSNPELNTKVGKVDTTVQKALGQRFSVQAYPSFFVIAGSSVFEYDDGRTKTSFIKFATKGYKDQLPIPFFSSPMGPLGRLQGILIWAGISMMSIFGWLQKTTGLSALFTGCLLCVLAVFGGMFTMIIMVVVLTTSDKPHRD